MAEYIRSLTRLGDDTRQTPRTNLDSASESDDWCKTCFNLNINILKEIWGHTPDELGRVIFQNGKSGIWVSEKGYGIYFDLSLIEAPKSSGCGFCAFLNWIIIRFEAREERYQRVYIVELTWQDGIVLTANGQRIDIYRPAGKNKSVSAESRPSYSHIPVRPDISLPNTKESFNYLKAWLKICDEYHSNCTQSPMPPPPKRLLHVGNTLVHLCEPLNEFQHRYVTLSYCWGQDDFLKLCESTNKLLHDGVEVGKLPRTVQDAMHIMRELGLEYLWVDALCIMQDNKTDWEQQSGKMCSIYERAYLTIAASTAHSANISFLNKDNLRPKPQYYATKTGLTLAARVQCANGHHYQPEYNRHQVVPDPISTRGWALQESLLSTRIIFYSAEELQWRCKTKRSCECQMPPSDEQPALIHNALEPKKILGGWGKIVQMYTQRTLSYQEDKLPAMSGIAQSIHRLTGWTYLAGLWSHEIIRQLLWVRYHLVGPISHPLLPLTYRAPTFSWAAVDYPVSMLYSFEEYDNFIDDARLIDWKMGLGTDPFGRVEYGSLTMDGKLIHSCEVHVSTSGNRSPGPLEVGPPKYFISYGDKEWYFDADVFLGTFDFTDSKGSARRSVRRLCRNGIKDVPDLESGSMVSLFLLEHSNIFNLDDKLNQHFLVLGVSPSDTEKYERLGILATYDQAIDVGNTLEQITIL
ncbi:hypothetical protein M434DRAFT_395149 [Hypoxylon sp. CO27-5]|nr:hypothetical protein M434DRAFT_395149 [Hypoxylon sp. CO27-5]